MRKRILRRNAALAALLAAALLLAACGGQGDGASQDSQEGTSVDEATYYNNGNLPFRVSSSAVTDGVLDDAYGMHANLPYEFDIASVSLPLTFENAPEGTVAYAIIMEDPDSMETAGFVWDHWLAANITAASLPAGASIELYGEMVQGMNSFEKVGYGGPQPPSGTHNYRITVYALSEMLPLENGFSRSELDAALKAPGVVLDLAQLYAGFSAQG